MRAKTAVETFIEGERANGSSDQDIRHKLLDAGWHMDIIQWAMNDITGDRAKPEAETETTNSVNLLEGALLGFRRFRSLARR